MKNNSVSLRRKGAKALYVLLAFSLLVTVFFGTGCQKQQSDLWDSATYTTDTTLGTGDIAVPIEVEADGKTVSFTVNAYEGTVGDALLNVGLIEGEEGPYGLYVKTVNGITADYDTDGAYWAFYINGDYGMTGVDLTPITPGEVYRFVYSK